MSEVVQENENRTSLVVVLSGPSGVGKDAVIAHLRTLGSPYHSVVTATTRPKRQSEEEGVDYIFLTPDEFDHMLVNDEFMEFTHFDPFVVEFLDFSNEPLQKDSKIVLLDADGNEIKTIQSL